MTISSTPQPLRLAGLAAAVALALGLAACGERNSDATVGQRVDSAVDRTEQAAANAGDSARRAMDKVEAKADDVSITASVNADLARDPDLSATRINVDTKNGVVTLSGPAPSAAAKERATTIARNVKGVSDVQNRLEVQAG